MQIGERATLTLTVDASAGLVSVRPRLEDRLGELEVLSIEASPETRGVDRWQQRWLIAVTSFETGRLAVPEIPLEYVSADGRTFLSPWSPRLAIELTGPAVTADTPLRALTARADAPPPAVWPRVLAGILVVAVLVPLCGIPLTRWWLRRLNRARHAAFYQSLAAELAQLATSPCTDVDDARVRYTRASSLVRQGAAPIAGGSIDALTSPELARRVSETREAAGLASRLGVVLRAVDIVRFANRVPALAQHSATLHEAQGVVGGLGTARAANAANTARSAKARPGRGRRGAATRTRADSGKTAASAEDAR